ncbi:D-arabinono-1,4-lactone oxidase [Sciscionella sediminilitoris]|uniref:D-arabinono-1,4-lactone oxidase n=1 Tax=Sciscionella sediminilitoris TaxID=1445613 RepID=UPI0005685275|nr:D-arabinono-1,4-lactone oxidase [Sciscionella sp. SE31]
MPSTPPVPFRTEQRWTNWGGNQSCTPAFTVRPRTEQEVLDAVRFAIREGLPVRAMGAGHSFTPIVATDGVLIETDALTGITGTDSARRRVRMRGGTPISEIGDPLWDNGLSLSNQGDIDKQSISGAIATATHGSGIEYTSFSERLRWVRLVTGHGEIVEIGEEDLHRLRAAQVAVGTLGIMTEVELAVSPRYHLREEISYPHWDQLREQIGAELAANRHFSFLWCPQPDSAALYELPTPDGLDMTGRAYTKKYVEAELAEPGDLVTEEGRRADRAYRIYAGGFMIPFHELEYYVPAERGLEAIEAMQDLMRTRFPNERYPLETRWVKGDQAYLSPFHGRDTTVLSVSGAPETDYWPYLRAVDELLGEFGARCHWGKIHFLDRDRVARLYPEFESFRAVRRELDPDGVFLNATTRRLFG